MSLRNNVLASYASQIYVTLIGIVMVPLYIRYMGAETYGLVGFFALLQAWFQLLDLGLTPTMARETARFRGGACDAHSLRRLLRALEGIFVGTAALGAALMCAGAGRIATDWLKVEQLPLDQVRSAVMLMALVVALRWVSGLYRGAVSGFERLVWLSGFNSAVATLRFVLVIPYLIHVGASPEHFFAYQLVVAAVELAGLVAKTYALMPVLHPAQGVRWEWAPLKGVLKFSLSIAFTSSVWVMVTQTDKLVLSKLLPLSEYAYFTLAVLVAGGVGIVSGPISGVMLPRLTRLVAQGAEQPMLTLYRQATQLVALIAVPVSLMLAFFSEQVLWAWTGNAGMAQQAAPVLTLYAVGNGILALAAFPYYLQYAKGDLRLHFIGNVLFAVLLIPALIWATMQYGVRGAGWAWLGANLAYFLGWVPRVHARFAPHLHWPWLLSDVAPIVAASTAVAACAYATMDWPADRAATGIWLAVLGLLLVTVAAAVSSSARALFGTYLAQLRHAKGRV